MTRRRIWAANALWGDGIADDGWAEMAAVSRWDDVHPDEYIRLFPALARRVRPTPSVLLDHLAEAVAVQAGRLRRDDGAASLVPDVTSGGAVRDLMWSASWQPWRVWLSRLGFCRTPAVVAGDAAAAAQLGSLLTALRDGRSVAFSEGLALTVAFHAALHPAYLWPEAVALADCATAAGWLGMVARGRPALMPLEVAIVIGDAVDIRPPGVGRLRDTRFSLCGFSGAQWATLGHAAHRRLSGRHIPVRLKAATRDQPNRFVMVDAATIPARATPQ